MKQTLHPVLFLIVATAGAMALGCATVHATEQGTPAKQTSAMKIRIKLENKTLTATLADSATSVDFASLLPLTLTLKNYAATEKISDLPRKLSSKGAPAGFDPDVGDIAYYAPWGNLAIYYKDFGYSDGLIRLGRLDGDAAVLNTAGELEVTIELIK